MINETIKENMQLPSCCTGGCSGKGDLGGAAAAVRVEGGEVRGVEEADLGGGGATAVGGP